MNTLFQDVLQSPNPQQNNFIAVCDIVKIVVGIFSPKIVTTTQEDAQKRALHALSVKEVDTLLSVEYFPEKVKEIFSGIDCVFADADGTLVDEGLVTFPKEYALSIEKLHALGIKTTLLTGKPYEETMQLTATLPKNSPLKIIYEKGAYCLEKNTAGAWQKHYLLSSPELEKEVAALRKAFLAQKQLIEDKYKNADGTPKLTIGWAGKGNHKSTISLDILSGTPPENYMDMVGEARENIKVKDPTLLTLVEKDLQEFVDACQPGWHVVHLGNGNSEIAPGPIEKDLAILQTGEFKSAHGVLILGDSGNDANMFALSKMPHVWAGLVLHREKSVDLLPHVDFVSFGMANAKPFFEELLLTHQKK